MTSNNTGSFVIVAMPCNKVRPFAVCFNSDLGEALKTFNSIYKTKLTISDIKKQIQEQNGDVDEKESEFDEEQLLSFYYYFDIKTLSQETKEILKNLTSSCVCTFGIYCEFTQTGNILEVVKEADDVST